MNLFLAGWSPSGLRDAEAAGRAVERTLEGLPYFDAGSIRTWAGPSGRTALAWVGHGAERLGGVRHVDCDDSGFGLFTGRPVRWTGPASADGRGTLDPSLYRLPAAAWAASLDGRCAALRWDEELGELEVFTDALGSHPLYDGTADGTRWISNSAALVHAAAGGEQLDEGALASVLGCGFSMGGRPVWRPVRRLPSGRVLRLRAGGEEADDVLPLSEVASYPGAGFDPGRAAEALVALTGALADWPGRPVLLQLSGGRDSRLVLAAALEAGVEFEAVSHGHAADPDAAAARGLCERAGRPHRLVSPAPGTDVPDRIGEAARVIGATSGGAFSLEDAAGYPLEQSSGPLPLWLGGQGGEIARRNYGETTAGDAGGLCAELTQRTLNSAPVLNERGESLVRGRIEALIGEQLDAGAAAEDVPDLFYLYGRMAGWAAVGFGAVEYAKGDSVSPLWSRGMLPHQLGPSVAERAAGTFPDEVLQVLSPELAGRPYVAALPGASEPSNLERLRSAADRAVSGGPAHAAWCVLDRERVDALLAGDPAGYGDREERALWRLTSVFARSELSALA